MTVASGVEVAGPRTDSTTEGLPYRRLGARAAATLRAPTTLGGVALFAVTYGLLAGVPVGHADEAWFLWVLTRMSRGQTLYRDVYFVSTPIPAWIGVVAVRLFGSHILVTRALMTLTFTVSTCLGWVAARRCGVGRAGRVLLAAAFFVYASPVANFASFYSGLAVLFTLATLVVLLRWLDERTRSRTRDRRDVLVLGLLAGLSFACKPNVGLSTLGAVAVIVVAATIGAEPWSWARPLGRIVGAFTVVCAVTILIVVATGAWSGFTADVFAGKAHYLDVFTGGYLPGLRHVERIVPLFGPPAHEYASRLWYSASLVPVIAALLAVTAWAVCSGPRRFHAAALTAFAAVGAVSLVPRGGPQHLTETAPLFLVVIAGAAGLLAPTRAAPRLGRALATLLAVWLTIATGAIVVRAVDPLGQRTESLTGLPHVVGAVVADHTVRGVRTVATQARQEHATDLFIIRPDAGYYYLTARLTDPTPFDFPGISDLGAGDQDGVIRLLRRGHVRWVCVGDSPTAATSSGSPTRPLRLEAYVRRAFVYAAHLRICDLYRFPARPPRPG